MMQPDIDELLEHATGGDPSAREQLLDRFRHRLRQMVAVRLDHRLAARVDPSDVVQEVLMKAADQLNGYLHVRPLPFYPWLRQIAWEHLVKLHRRHITTRRRSVTREVVANTLLSDESANDLVNRLVAPGNSPSDDLVRQEMRERVRESLDRMDEGDREVLVMRYLEGLSWEEVAAVLGANTATVKMRHTRALRRLCGLLGGPQGGEA